MLFLAIQAVAPDQKEVMVNSKKPACRVDFAHFDLSLPLRTQECWSEIGRGARRILIALKKSGDVSRVTFSSRRQFVIGTKETPTHKVVEQIADKLTDGAHVIIEMTYNPVSPYAAV